MLDYRFNILYSSDTNKKLTLQDISSSQGRGAGGGLVWFGLGWVDKHEGQKNIGFHDMSYASYSSKLYIYLYL